MNKRGANKINSNKKGVLNVVLTILIIVLILASVVIVWWIIKNFFYGSIKEINFQSENLFLNLKLQKVQIDSNTGNILVTIQRGAGQGDLTGIAFIISDGSNSVVVKKTINMSVLEKTSFIITHSELGNISFVKEIKIAPIIKTSSGNKMGNVVDEMEIINTVGVSYPSSCLDILNSGGSHGDGIYSINPNGISSEKNFNVYCDMTTDGGGWTLVGRSDPGNTINWNCTSNPAPGIPFGWRVDSGNVNSDSSHYSINLSSKHINFTEILFGSYSSGKNWGNYVYEQRVNSTFLNDWAGSAYYIGNPIPIKGGNTDFNTAKYIGFTNNPDIYHWMSSNSNGYGLSSKGWATCLGTQTSLVNWGGDINTFQGMMMVR